MKTNNYNLEENFLKSLANAYNDGDVNSILSMIAEDFTYDSMWFLSQMTSKQEYSDYIIAKVSAIRKGGTVFNFCMMVSDQGKPYLIFTPKTPEGDFGCFYVETNEHSQIKALHLMGASFFNLKYKDKQEFDKFIRKSQS